MFVPQLPGEFGLLANLCRAKIRRVPTAFGENLSRARRRAKLSQTKLAAKLGITPSTVNRWETKASSDPKLSTVYRLADALSCQPEELVAIDGEGARRDEPGLPQSVIAKLENALARADVPGQEGERVKSSSGETLVAVITAIINDCSPVEIEIAIDAAQQWHQKIRSARRAREVGTAAEDD